MRRTIRTFDKDVRDDIHNHATTLAQANARGSRATQLVHQQGPPVTFNDAKLAEGDVFALSRVAGETIP